MWNRRNHLSNNTHDVIENPRWHRRNRWNPYTICCIWYFYATLDTMARSQDSTGQILLYSTTMSYYSYTRVTATGSQEANYETKWMRNHCHILSSEIISHCQKFTFSHIIAHQNSQFQDKLTWNTSTTCTVFMYKFTRSVGQFGTEWTKELVSMRGEHWIFIQKCTANLGKPEVIPNLPPSSSIHTASLLEAYFLIIWLICTKREHETQQMHWYHTRFVGSWAGIYGVRLRWHLLDCIHHNVHESGHSHLPWTNFANEFICVIHMSLKGRRSTFVTKIRMQKNIGNFTTLLKSHNIGTHLKGIETSFQVVPLF
jgi:hypothetical protein